MNSWDDELDAVEQWLLSLSPWLQLPLLMLLVVPLAMLLAYAVLWIIDAVAARLPYRDDTALG